MAESPNLLLDEWKETRATIKSFDDRLQELRKYGFTLITGLLAIQGLVLPYLPVGPATEVITETKTFNGTNLDPEEITIETVTTRDVSERPSSGLRYEIKFAILAVTAILVIALKFLDSNLLSYLTGAAMRSKVIERFLNLEVSEAISQRSQNDELRKKIRIIYYAFEFTIILLAFFLLPGFPHLNTSEYSSYMIVMSSALGIGIWIEIILFETRAEPYKLKENNALTRWALDRIQCKKGDQIRIMVTNVTQGEEGIRHLYLDQKIWDVFDDNGKSVIKKDPHPAKMKRDVFLKFDQSYVWILDVEMKPGLYHVRVDMDDEGKRQFLPLDNAVQERPRPLDGIALEKRIQVLPTDPEKKPGGIL